MLEIAAHADAFGVHAQGGARGIGELVAEGNFVVYSGANFAHALPTFGKFAE